MGVYVTFINPSVPHKAENLHLGWDFKDAVAFHKGLVMHGKAFVQKTDECVVVGTEKEGTIQMDVSKVHWILEEANVVQVVDSPA